MSNRLAIGALTATLQRRAQDAARTTVREAVAQVGPPLAQLARRSLPTVNIYLYQVHQNPQLRNEHTPGRQRDGAAGRASRISLDLSYLISFYGDAADFVPERMMSAVALAFDTEPILSRAAVQEAVAVHSANLGDVDLYQALSTVRVKPESLSLEDTARLWSALFQRPYTLSLCYKCTHLNIETEDVFAPAMPAAGRWAPSGPFESLAIESIHAQEGGAAPISWGSTLLIEGRGLRRKGLRLRLGSQEITPRPDELLISEDGDALRVALETARFGGAALPAGLVPVRLISQPANERSDGAEHSSEVAAFHLRPRLSMIGVSLSDESTLEIAKGSMRVRFDPPLIEGQDVRVAIDQISPDASYSAMFTPSSPLPAAEIDVAFEGAPRGQYAVAAQVDGVGAVPGAAGIVNGVTNGASIVSF
ncbi:MAG: DUF4255 domain-containing protein [Rhodobacteraceae bacterium]|nr:DUF4255 domain-containing protein [Paracoccaceae bacterium]